MDDASTHEYASVLGSALKSGEKMYIDLQQAYQADAIPRNPDYDYV